MISPRRRRGTEPPTDSPKVGRFDAQGLCPVISPQRHSPPPTYSPKVGRFDAQGLCPVISPQRRRGTEHSPTYSPKVGRFDAQGLCPLCPCASVVRFQSRGREGAKVRGREGARIPSSHRYGDTSFHESILVPPYLRTPVLSKEKVKLFQFLSDSSRPAGTAQKRIFPRNRLAVRKILPTFAPQTHRQVCRAASSRVENEALCFCLVLWNLVNSKR